MPGKVLLFNLSSAKLAKLRMLLLRAGIGCRVVNPAEQGMTIGALAGTGSTAAAAAEGFTGEMMVMCGLDDGRFNALLAAMRANGVSIPLKAVMTETNAGWTAGALYKELCAEHEAMHSRGREIHRQPE